MDKTKLKVNSSGFICVFVENVAPYFDIPIMDKVQSTIKIEWDPENVKKILELEHIPQNMGFSPLTINQILNPKLEHIHENWVMMVENIHEYMVLGINRKYTSKYYSISFFSARKEEYIVEEVVSNFLNELVNYIINLWKAYYQYRETYLISFTDMIYQLCQYFGAYSEWDNFLGKLSMLSHEFERDLSISLIREKLVRKQSQKSIKDFQDVKIGDIAYEHPTMSGAYEPATENGNYDNRIGVIKWKGSAQDALDQQGQLIDDPESFKNDMEDYPDWVVVEANESNGLGCSTLMNYDTDPCGIVVFE